MSLPKQRIGRDVSRASSLRNRVRKPNMLLVMYRRWRKLLSSFLVLHNGMSRLHSVSKPLSYLAEISHLDIEIPITKVYSRLSHTSRGFKSSSGRYIGACSMDVHDDRLTAEIPRAPKKKKQWESDTNEDLNRFVYIKSVYYVRYYLGDWFGTTGYLWQL